MGEKLADNIQDDNSKIAKILKSLTQKQIDRATEILEELKFPLSQALDLRHQQKSVEAKARGHNFAEVTEPSAQAVAMLLSHTAILANRPENAVTLGHIGQNMGRLITLLDACWDYQKDNSKNKFNALASTLPQNLSTSPISPYFYDSVENFLLMQLQEIRQQTANLVLYYHKSTVENILFMGLYDSVRLALNKLAKNVMVEQPHHDSQNDSQNLRLCPHCNTLISSRFCPNCGINVIKNKQ